MRQQALFKDKKLPPEPESATLRACKDYLTARNLYFLRLNSGEIYLHGRCVLLCPEGTPDLFVLYRGVALFVELKKVGENPTLIQQLVHSTIQKHGGRLRIAWSVDDLIDELKHIDRLLAT